jgi:hypothetical protein
MHFIYKFLVVLLIIVFNNHVSADWSSDFSKGCEKFVKSLQDAKPKCHYQWNITETEKWGVKMMCCNYWTRMSIECLRFWEIGDHCSTPSSSVKLTFGINTLLFTLTLAILIY